VIVQKQNRLQEIHIQIIIENEQESELYAMTNFGAVVLMRCKHTTVTQIIPHKGICQVGNF